MTLIFQYFFNTHPPCLMVTYHIYALRTSNHQYGLEIEHPLICPLNFFPQEIQLARFPSLCTWKVQTDIAQLI